jgi:hypothetical protein
MFFLVVVSFFLFPVIVSTFGEFYSFGDRDHTDIDVVTLKTAHYVVCPRLESLWTVKEYITLQYLSLYLRSGLPAVPVLSYRDERLRLCGIARYLLCEVPEDEKRGRGYGRPGVVLRSRRGVSALSAVLAGCGVL